jgi:hypothetical protein
MTNPGQELTKQELSRYARGSRGSPAAQIPHVPLDGNAELLQQQPMARVADP